MKIFLHGGSQAQISDIENIEKSLGNKLPNDFKTFIHEFNGAIPEPNVYCCNNKDEFYCGVTAFIPIDKASQEAELVKVPLSIPIAHAEGGNYIVLNVNDGSIMFWDHETEEMITISLFFGDFIENLEPIKSRLSAIDNPIVESAWVDPDFLKSIQQ